MYEIQQRVTASFMNVLSPKQMLSNVAKAISKDDGCRLILALDEVDTYINEAFHPHRTIVSPEELENKQIKILCNALKTEMKKELRLTE